MAFDIMFKRMITPRVSETNLSGHIAHCTIPVWFEEGWRDIFKLFGDDIANPPLITASLNINFLHEMFFDRDAEITTAVQQIGNTSFTVHQEVRQDGKLCVRGSTTFVHFDYLTRKPAPIPQDRSDMLNRHLSLSS